MQYFIHKTDSKKEAAGKILRQNGISGRTLKKIRQGAGRILYQKKVITERTKINGEATLILDLKPEQPDPNVAQSTLPIEIITEDQHFLALNKDAQTTSVPGPANSTTTLANRALGYAQTQSQPYVPHILTRLDFDTSGVVLFAKSNFIQSMVQDQITNHTMKKEYLAVVSGRLPNDHGMIDLPLKKESYESARRIVASDGKPSQTEYWVQERFEDATMIKVRLHTGRTHQIRAHFAHLGFPLIGDELYGGPTQLIHRQMLHAAHLELVNPFTDQPESFNASLPDDFQDALIHLRKNQA
ncbi:RluA family pseudouridine synthase [Ligilactobacillus aviarius]|uniref:Pseudouridine synthase n=1 Tax=Ligilactobacillus aviarius TaxID=1606 RepID=A0A510WTU8_9LACO|nr:RluA family pseudouridine synthase [Ligilactobacillus aviarius]KRM39195.1 RluA family pseudouridine synthase [Ligilactobacillus aviarius subsp. aviarius DSM 20655]GEK42653.1 pseudouridine synthase [Ligilactobacillus aviarius]HJH33037.1 RluA family pseudouridine synthase [Ligilactobacillus aviarius]